MLVSSMYELLNLLMISVATSCQLCGVLMSKFAYCISPLDTGRTMHMLPMAFVSFIVWNSSTEGRAL
jgi:hypothetical protein